MSELNDHHQAGSGLIPASPPGFRSGFVGIIGRPNVGKSTLMNYLVGQKIAITSPVAQTTRNRLRGILTTPTAQIIFVDTPGIHKPHHQLGKVLVKNAQVAIQSVDALLFVVDGSVEAGGGDRFIANLLTHCQIPIILGINKADQQQGEQEGARSRQAIRKQRSQRISGHRKQWRQTIEHYKPIQQNLVKTLRSSLTLTPHPSIAAIRNSPPANSGALPNSQR
jgi:GTP-binding protein Era